MREVLGIPTIRQMWFAQIVSVFGDMLALFAVISVAGFRMNATPEQLTWIQIFYMLPIAVLGILAGVFVDRWPVKTTLVASDLTRAVLTLFLMAATQIWHFYIVLSLISIVSSFFSPAQGVAVRNAVPREGLRAANTLMQQVFFIMRIAGPMIAGLMVSLFGPRSCYMADTASFVTSGLLLASTAIHRPDSDASASPETEHTGIRKILHDMQQGLNFIFHHAGLFFVVLAMAAAMFIMGCFGPLIAIYVRESLHGSVRIFGIISGMIGFGLLVGVNLLHALAKNVKNEHLVYGGLLGIAAGVLLMASFIWTPSAMFGAFFIGASVAAIIVPAQTLTQQETPPALLGRVGSTTMSVVFAAQISGLVISGVLTQLTSVRTVFFLCSAVLLVLIFVGRIFLKPHAPATAVAD